MKNLKICVIYGGQSSEREVSLRTGAAVHNSLVSNGYTDVVLLDLDFNNMDEILTVKPDVCFNALHGRVGEDGVLQGFLDRHGIKYTGTGAANSAIAFDKDLSKLKFKEAGIPTPAYRLVNKGDNIDDMLPCVVKPAKEGSTVGISIVKKNDEVAVALADAFKYDDKVMAEAYISGKEFTVAVFEGEVYPPIWIKPDSGFYDYQSKYTRGATQYLFNLEISEQEKENVKKTALAAYKCIGCKGVARIDIMYDGKTPYVLEINTAPGMTETSLLPKAANEKGISFIELVEKMLTQALES